ncbi:MAG: peroxide stress protein YaaA [Alphaproteobacteria bacterium]|nr:peroxide stress protein YaaA [Alphaproteobacteria bacterium]
MIILLSPAKKLYEDLVRQDSNALGTPPYFQQETQQLLQVMQKKSAKQLQQLMGISEKLGALNHDRYQKMAQQKMAQGEAKQSPALLTFAGDVYQHLAAQDFSPADIDYAQKHLMILSGFYGLLRAQDFIMPYRLEMGVNLKIGKANNLADFWRNKITAYLQELLKAQDNPIILNLASNEYSRAVDSKAVSNFINVGFRQRRGNQLKNIGLFAKQARGALARAIIKTRTDTLDGVRQIKFNDYQYDDTLSNDTELMFVRAQE